MIGSHPGGTALTRRLLELAGIKVPDSESMLGGIELRHEVQELTETERQLLVSGFPEKICSGLNSADNQHVISGFAEKKSVLRVLDLGAGTGETAGYLQKLGYDVCGIDRRVEASVQAAVGGKISKGEMTALPFPDQSFDLCLAECSVSVCGDGPAAMKEAYRVLRPGGSFLLSDICFSKEGAPCLSMPGPVTQALWEQECVRAGFKIRAWRDETSLWREFFLESLWNGNADESFCDFFRNAGKAGCGYFLAWLLKGGRDGFI